jgi:oligosaccharide repeat unit polymerase
MIVFYIVILIILIFSYLIIRIKNVSERIYLVDSFLIGITTYTIGSIILYRNLNDSISHNILELSLITFISATIGAIFGLFIKKRKNIVFKKDYLSTKILIFFSCFITLIFIFLVIKNDEIYSQLIGFFIDDNEGYNSIRKQITSGSSGYFAPGYIKQFRDIMGPIAIVSLIAYRNKINNKLYFIVPFLIILTGVFLSGQRGVLFVFILLLFLALTKKIKIMSMRTIIYIIAGLFSFSFFSIFLGRNDPLSENSLFLQAFIQITERIFLVLPLENYNSSGIWFGNVTYGVSWISEISKILPGTDFGLSNLMHSANLGSYEGNSVLGLPIDIYYSFGYFGVIIFPILYSLFLSVIDRKFLNSDSNLILFSKIFLFIQLPFMFSPYGFILYGGAFVLLLRFILFIFEKLKYDTQLN